MSKPQKTARLTPTQRKVAELLALGYTCREIAERLGSHVKTIDTHRAAILLRLGLRNNVAIARFAVREAWVPLDASVDASLAR